MISREYNARDLSETSSDGSIRLSIESAESGCWSMIVSAVPRAQSAGVVDEHDASSMRSMLKKNLSIRKSIVYL